MKKRMRIGVFGWGIVAPKSPDIAAFRKNLASSETWLSPFDGFGPDNFLVGMPAFCFDVYQKFIDARFAPRYFQNLKEKMDLPTLYAMGSFIQALGQNPGIEEEIKALGSQAHVYVGTGLGAIDTTYRASIRLYEAQKKWDCFWAKPERNSALREYASQRKSSQDSVPALPESVDEEDRSSAEQAWNQYWMAQSPEL